jgi:hypothetical protein
MRAADRASGRVVTVAHVLGSGARYPACARRAYESVLARDTAPGDLHFINRWTALKGLDYLLVSAGRAREAGALLDSATASGMQAAVSLHIVNAVAGAQASESRAASAMASLATMPINRMSTTRLRYVSLWAMHRRDTTRLDSVARRSGILADSSRLAADRAVHDVATARLALLRGDSVSAARALTRLRPAAEPGPMAWDLFAGLSAERLLAAEVMLAQGNARAAIEIADVFDSPHAQIDLLHLPRSLELRIRAAAQLGDLNTEGVYRDRLRKIVGPPSR